jgi:hypothetical protein
MMLTGREDMGRRRLGRCLMVICLTAALAAALLWDGCAPARAKFDDGTDPHSPDSALLSNGFRSLDELGRATVKALNDSSAEELAKLLVTRDEFRDVIFARTPDSLKAGLTWDHAWFLNAEDDNLAIRRKLDALGGKNLTFVRTTVKDTTTVFPGKTTYRNVIISAVNPANGQPVEFRFLNVVAMVGGRCKAVAFHK